MKFEDCLGEGFHAGLRKFCDSDASSKAYRVIVRMSDRGYVAFLQQIRDGLNGLRRPRSYSAFGRKLKSVALASPTKARELKVALAALDDYEWRNLAESISWALVTRQSQSAPREEK